MSPLTARIHRSSLDFLVDLHVGVSRVNFEYLHIMCHTHICGTMYCESVLLIRPRPLGENIQYLTAVIHSNIAYLIYNFKQFALKLIKKTINQSCLEDFSLKILWTSSRRQPYPPRVLEGASHPQHLKSLVEPKIKSNVSIFIAFI